MIELLHSGFTGICPEPGGQFLEETSCWPCS